MPFYATQHTDYKCPHCNQDIQVKLFDVHASPSIGCPNCNHNLWDDLDIDNSDVFRTISYGQKGLDIDVYNNEPRAYFADILLTAGMTIVKIHCDSCNQVHCFNQAMRDSVYNSIKDEWGFHCNNVGQPNPLANQSLNTLLRLDRWIEKQTVLQRVAKSFATLKPTQSIMQRFGVTINPTLTVPADELVAQTSIIAQPEPKSTRFGGLSKEEWDALKPWQQFKHLDKIKNPGYYYQEGKPLF
jgi:DNA-directed RNA polymerase subunit RPC12/RpoP